MTADCARTIVVTGSTRGLGFAIIRQLIASGCHVIGSYNTSESLAKELQGEHSGRASFHRLELQDPASWREFSDFVHRAVPKLDGLVNCAGEIPRPADWETISVDTWEATLRINLSSHFFMIRSLADLLKKSTMASVVNVGSVYGSASTPAVIAYSAAKAALESVTKSMAIALAPNVRVNAVLPGNFATDMTRGAGPEVIDYVTSKALAGRLGQPEELAGLASFLLSNEASYINGALFRADGGYLLT